MVQKCNQRRKADNVNVNVGKVHLPGVDFTVTKLVKRCGPSAGSELVVSMESCH